MKNVLHIICLSFAGIISAQSPVPNPNVRDSTYGIYKSIPNTPSHSIDYGGTGMTFGFNYSDKGDYATDVIFEADGAALFVGHNYKNLSFDTSAIILARIDKHGQLDTAWAPFGRRVIQTGSSIDTTLHILILADGKFLMAGSTKVALGTDRLGNLMRLKANGHIDSTFGVHGRVSIPHLQGVQDEFRKVLIRPDGKLHVVGTRWYSPNVHQWVDSIRFFQTVFTQDGQIDTSFNHGEVLFSSFIQGYCDMHIAKDAVIDSIGRITVCGYMLSYLLSHTGGCSDTEKGAFARFLPDGRLDPEPPFNFLNAGNFRDYFGDPGATKIFLEPDGKFLVTGFGEPHPYRVKRYFANGTLDTSFGVNGYVYFSGIYFFPASITETQLINGKYYFLFNYAHSNVADNESYSNFGFMIYDYHGEPVKAQFFDTGYFEYRLGGKISSFFVTDSSVTIAGQSGGVSYAYNASLKYLIPKEITTSQTELHTPLVQVFPNPSSGMFYMGGVAGEVYARVYDSHGRVSYSSKLDRPEIDLSDHPAGVYRLVLFGKNFTTSRMLIKL